MAKIHEVLRLGIMSAVCLGLKSDFKKINARNRQRVHHNYDLLAMVTSDDRNLRLSRR
jgi:hypothetical protein